MAAKYCKLVDASRLGAEDIRRLDRGRMWLDALVEVVTTTHIGREVVDSGLIAVAPATSLQSIDTEDALKQFRRANEAARIATADILLDSPSALITTTDGTVACLDMARHLVRISNSCSVDRRWIGGPDQEKVELVLVDETPVSVAGPRAFVLFQPQVGRVEVGSPLPGDRIWDHVEGDVRYTMVHQRGGGISGGGGKPWDSEELAVHWSQPSPSSRDDAYVVIGRIPEHFVKVAVDQDDLRRVQTPIHGTAVLPLTSDGSPLFRVFGIWESGDEFLLFESRN